jgi:branched-chain amino acid transport system substrate-binding protein
LIVERKRKKIRAGEGDKVKRTALVLLTLALAVLWSGSALADDAVRFGCSISLTGKLAHEGKLTRDGYEFYKAMINKKGGLNIGGKKYKVDIKYYDDESNVQTATKLIEKLITEDKIDFILGPYGSGPSFATSAIAEKYKRVMMLPMAAAPDIFERGFKYIFGVLATTDVYLVDIFHLAAKQTPKPKTVAVLWKNDLANKGLADPIPALCKENGMTLVYNEKFAAGATDFSSELAVVKSKNPDIFVFLSQADQFILAMKQIKDQKINTKMIMNGIAVPQPGVVKALGRDADYLVGPTHWHRTSTYKDGLFGNSEDYSREFKKQFGYDPEYHNVGSSAGIQVMGIAIEKAGSFDVEKVRNTLSAMKTNTFWGPIQFDAKGKIVGRSMPVGQILKGAYTVVAPSEIAKAKLVYPKPAWQ